ncbi:MAG: arginine--tRNA ligase [Pseudomonadota bacterium]
MKQTLQNVIRATIETAVEKGLFSRASLEDVAIETPNLAVHGDFSTNLAMVMAKTQKMAPRKIAEAIVQCLDDPSGLIAKTEIAGPGFINFFINPLAWRSVLDGVVQAGEHYGRSSLGQGTRIQVEFVSANPTGPLHVGHGRGAAIGDSMARILAASGYAVQKEYYVNDSGRQISTLGKSVYYRYQELFDIPVDFPEDGYQGDYIRDLAVAVRDAHGRGLLDDHSPEEAIAICARAAAGAILDGIKKDLENFGVTYDQWFSEQSLYDDGRVMAAIDALKAEGTVYEKDGALWFRSTDYGDEKDRVVVRQNGLTTYFASDIAYHQEKYQRGFDRVIDVWGADHHGYIPRVTAAVEASGRRKDQFDVILVHLVNLLRAGAPVAMSTRSGEFVTLEDVVDEVGRDAARFIFLTRHSNSPLDFDLELAKQKTNENPVYYVQYVHARISSILRKVQDEHIDFRPATDAANGHALTEPEEIALIRTMGAFPEVVQRSARLMEPHRVTFFLMELASAFHAYYNKHRVIGDDPDMTGARLYLVEAVRRVIRNGLSLLGVSAPETM